jgi:hypothetical protein
MPAIAPLGGARAGTPSPVVHVGQALDSPVLHEVAGWLGWGRLA